MKDLPPEVKETVDQMLLVDTKYKYILEYISDNGEKISLSCLWRYAQHFKANVQMVTIASENFRYMMDEIQKYPDLDVTEAITRLAAQNIFNALANTEEDAWLEVSPDKMMREANALVRAVAYKKRIDVQNSSAQDSAMDEVKALVFDAVKKERPELYDELAKFLNGKKVAEK